MAIQWTTDKNNTFLIDDVDVAPALISYTIQGNYTKAMASGNAVFGSSKLPVLKADIMRGMLVNIKRQYTVVVDEADPVEVEYPVFDGVIRVVERSKGRTTLTVDDMLTLLQRVEINKIYGTADHPLDLSEIMYDVVTSAGLNATFGTTSATIRTSGETTTGMVVSHTNGHTLAQTLASALNWQLYYSPADKMVHFEPKGYWDQYPHTFETGVDVLGHPQWADDDTLLCNSCTVMPGRYSQRAIMYHTLTSALQCTYGYSLSLTIPRKPYAATLSLSTDNGATFVRLNGHVNDGEDWTASVVYSYDFFPNKDTGNLIIYNNSYAGGGTAFADFPANAVFMVTYWYDTPDPQTYKDNAAIAANGGVEVPKTFSRSDLTPADALKLARSTVNAYKSPLETVNFRYGRAPAPFIYLGQKHNLIDHITGRSASELVLSSFEFKYPQPFDELKMGELMLYMSDYTVSLDERIRNLELGNVERDYTQTQYVPLAPPPGEEVTVLTSMLYTVGQSETVHNAALGYVGFGRVCYANGMDWLFYSNGSNDGWRAGPQPSSEGGMMDAEVDVTTPNWHTYELLVQALSDTTAVVKNASGAQVYPSSGSVTSQDAINWAQVNLSSDANWIRLSSGNFALTSQLRMYRNIQGSGNAGPTKTRLYNAGVSASSSVIIVCTSAPSSSSMLSNKQQCDFEYDGRKSTYLPTYGGSYFYGGIQHRWCSSTILRNVYVHDCGASHGVQWQASAGCYCIGCDVKHIGIYDRSMCYGNGYCSGTMYTTYTHDMTLYDCTAEDCSMVCYNWEPGYNNSVEHCYGGGNPDTWYTGSAYTPTRVVTVGPTTTGRDQCYGNTFLDCTFEGPGIIAAISGASTEFDSCYLITTSVNSNETNKTTIEFNALAAGSNIHDCILVKMSTSSASAIGIKFYSTINCIADDNVIYEEGVSGKGYGIWNNANGATITDNVVHNSLGAYQNSGTGTTISGNTTGTDHFVASSGEGEGWGNFTPIYSIGSDYPDFAMASDGTRVYYVRGYNTATLYYRRGILHVDGTIAWEGTENSISAGGTVNSVNCLFFDSAGALVCLYNRDGYIYAAKCTAHGTTWANDSGWPKQVSDSANSGLIAVGKPTASGKFYVIYGRLGQYVKGKEWKGTAFGDEETCSLLTAAHGYSNHLGTDGSSVFMTYEAVSGDDYRLMYRARSANGQWDASELDVIGQTVSSSYVGLALRGMDDVNYIIYANYPTAGHLYCKTVDGGVLSAATDLLADPDGITLKEFLTGCEDTANRNFLVAWLSGTSPYHVKLAKIHLGTGPAPPNPEAGDVVHVTNGNFYDASGNPVYFNGLNDSATLCGMWAARGSVYYPASTLSNPVGNPVGIPEESYYVAPAAVATAITISKSGDTFIATRPNGTTVASGTNAGAVINSAFTYLTSGRTSKEKVLMAASASITTRINLPSYTVFECADGVVLTSGTANQIIGGTSVQYFEIIGGEWVCGSTTASQSVAPMYFEGPSYFTVRNCKVRDCLYHNMVFTNSNYGQFYQVESGQSWPLDPMNCPASGWSAIMCATTSGGNASHNLVEDCYLHDMGHGGVYFYNEPGWTGTLSYNTMCRNTVKRCGTSGLSISQRSSSGSAHYNLIENNYLEDCGADNDHPYINIGYSSCYPSTTTHNVVRRNTLLSHDLAGPDTAEYGQRGADQGIINQGSYTEIYHNDIKLVRNAISLLCGTNLDVYENYIHDAPSYVGIFVNTPVANSNIHDNVLHNLGTDISGTGTDNTFTNNGDGTSPIPASVDVDVDTSSAEEIATYFYNYGLMFLAAGYNCVRIGAHTCWGLDCGYTSWRADATQFDRVLLSMAQGLEAAKCYFVISLSGFAETPESEGGDGYDNRQLLTSMTSLGSHVASTGHTTDNILYPDSTSWTNYCNYVAHVGDLLYKFKYFVGIDLANEPDNWRQHPVFWTPVYGDYYESDGAVVGAMKNWGERTASKIRDVRQHTSWLMTIGWTPLVGPPYHEDAITAPITNPANLIAFLASELDFASYHCYHFSNIFCDSANGGSCSDPLCGENNLHSAIKAACATAGLPAFNNEWGRYCDSAQVYVTSIATTLKNLGVHNTCIVPPARLTYPQAADVEPLPDGWDELGL